MIVAESSLPATLYAPSMTDAEFQEWCDRYSDYRIEYSAEGDLLIMPPTDPDTGERNSAIIRMLGNWALSTGQGAVTDSSTGFLLPNGSRRSPDAAWMTRDRKRMRPGCPQFVIELLSPTDRRRKTHEKMLEWIENGAELGWMIDPQRRSVSIYRPNREVEVREHADSVAGEGPVEGFVLDLREIWNVA